MSFSINGKTAIVTGAANGVGLAVARQFLENGANVMLADRDEERLKDEVGKAEDGSAARFFSGDLREHLTQANLLSATIDAFDRVDILVNACRQIATSDPLNPDEDSVELLLRQNLMTSLRLSQLVSRKMMKQSYRQHQDTWKSILNRHEVTLVCFCKADSVCHPYLLADYLTELGAEYMGERCS